MSNTKPKNSYREKLREAIVFFAQKGKIRNPSKMMMYKLLGEIDFRHFEQTGLPITDQHYEAFQWGPVPQPFHNEISKGNSLVLPEDFEEALTVQETFFEDSFGKPYKGFKFIAKRKPNLKIFSQRQLDVMEDVALIYKTASATEASKASHEPGKPWTITVQKKGELATIDLLETIELLKPLTKDIAAEKLRERAALDYNYGA